MIMTAPFPAYGIKDLNIDSDFTINQTRLGDYDQMVKKHIIRVLVPQSKTFYFLDGATPRGLAYETLKKFEETINKKLGNKVLKLMVLIIPTPRDRLIPALKNGLGDIAVGNLTITDKRLKQIDFCDPFLNGINEVLVSGPDAPVVKTIDDLSGLTIHVRKSSSYYESLVRLNKSFAAKKTAKIKIKEASEYLEDEDLLEMVNAEVIPMIIIDSHKGNFWAQFFDKITIHTDIKVRENSKIAWAIRKNSPKLKNVINSFVKKNKKGTLHGNAIFNKYLRFIMDRYFNDPEIDTLNKVLLTFASYNAGPNKISKLRKKAEAMGLDPNVWFRNVEIVAAKQIGRETVQYVSNIFKYYIAYKLILENKK